MPEPSSAVCSVTMRNSKQPAPRRCAVRLVIACTAVESHASTSPATSGWLSRSSSSSKACWPSAMARSSFANCSGDSVARSSRLRGVIAARSSASSLRAAQTRLPARCQHVGLARCNVGSGVGGGPQLRGGLAGEVKQGGVLGKVRSAEAAAFSSSRMRSRPACAKPWQAAIARTASAAANRPAASAGRSATPRRSASRPAA